MKVRIFFFEIRSLKLIVPFILSLIIILIYVNNNKHIFYLQEFFPILLVHFSGAGQDERGYLYKSKRNFQAIQISIDKELFDDLEKITIRIGKNNYLIYKDSITNYFNITYVDSGLLLSSNSSFIKKKQSAVLFLQNSLNYKGDHYLLIYSIIGIILSLFFSFVAAKNRQVLWFLSSFFYKIGEFFLFFENKITLILIKRIFLFLFALLFILVAYSCFSNFNITDDGYFFYLSQQGLNGSPSLSFFYFFTHPLGALFGHKLIIYRLLNLLFIVSAGIFFIYSIIRFTLKDKIDTDSFIIMLAVTGIAALNYFVYSPTPDYNSFAVFSAGGWAASVFQFLSSVKNRDGKRYLWVILIGVFIFLAISSRFTFGIPLYIVTILLFIIFKYLYSLRICLDVCLLSLWMLIMAMGVYFYLTPESIEEVRGWAGYYSSVNRFDDSQMSDVTVLILNYFKDLMYFFKNYILLLSLCIGLYLLTKKAIIKDAGVKRDESRITLLGLKSGFLLSVFVYIIYWNSSLILNEYFTHFAGWSYSREIFAAFIILIIYYMIKLNGNNDSKDRIVLFLVVTIGLMHPAGTNVNFFSVSSYALFLPAGLLIYLFYVETEGFQREKLVLLLFIIISTVHIGFNVMYEQFIFAKRNGLYTEQITYSRHSTYLSGIRISKDMAMHIDKLQLLLNKIDFDFERDRIFAFGDVPGLLSAVGAKAFGEPWVFIESNLTSGYKQSWSRACIAVKLCNKNSARYVYILKTNIIPIPEEIVACLDEYIMPFTGDSFVVHNLGEGVYHWYNKKVVYDITFEGPYKMNDK